MCKRTYNVDTKEQQSTEFPSILSGYLGFTGDKKKAATKISLQTLGEKTIKKRHPDLRKLLSSSGVSASSRTSSSRVKNLELHGRTPSHKPNSLSPSRMGSVDYNGVKVTVIGLWTDGKHVLWIGESR
ncbi:hypothetical protein TNCV_1016661 [Trichonephila clavipes]|uniref:Uncharacterized protein n=1 Tax=Trichonephila clavipes TaxID=2585209 RepID=A0A8X6VY37_TRICX|nr:hypothetical protein TNCV_1016661 [Trichonephila clavipes]